MYRGDVRPVMVECEITKGIGIHIVGIPDSAVVGYFDMANFKLQ